MTKKYRALVGLSYPDGRQALALCKEGKTHLRKEVEPGEIVSDIPPESIPWLIEDGRIEEVTDGDLRT